MPDISGDILLVQMTQPKVSHPYYAVTRQITDVDIRVLRYNKNWGK